MADSNDITGDSLTTKPSSEAYRSNYDAIFRKPKFEDFVVVADVAPPSEEQNSVPTVTWIEP